MHALDFTMKCHCAITFDDTLQQKQGNVKITIRTTAAKTKKMMFSHRHAQPHSHTDTHADLIMHR